MSFWNRLLGRTPRSRLRILVIDDSAPEPTTGAGAPRAKQFLRALAATGAAVTFFPTIVKATRDAAIIGELSQVNFVTGMDQRSLSFYLLSNYRAFDAIFVSRPHNLVFFNDACSKEPSIKSKKVIAYDAESLFSERDVIKRQVMKQPMSPDDAERSIRDELGLARGANFIIAVSDHAANLFRTAGYSDVCTLGHAVPPSFDPAPHSTRVDFLFVGPTVADDTPNTDSVVWFIDHVLPLIRAKLEQSVSLTLVGRTLSPLIDARRNQGLTICGPQDDLHPFFAKAKVFVAPTRFAAGIPLKIYHAAASGIPCVVTPLLAIHLNWTHEREVLVAETPEDFAQQCVRLYTDAALWERLRVTAFERVMHDCDVGLFDRTVANICMKAQSYKTEM